MILGVEQMSNPSPAATAILDALLAVVDQQGLDRATVREVASTAGISIGTVQHYFPTKDAMLTAAFAEVVRRIRARIEGTLAGSDDVRANLSAVLRELLPLDERRRTEARIQIAFAARAARSPALADLQREVLTDVHQALTTAFALICDDEPDAPRCRLAAHAALALTDGLALHAVSATGWLTEHDMTAALDQFLETSPANSANSAQLSI